MALKAKSFKKNLKFYLSHFWVHLIIDIKYVHLSVFWILKWKMMVCFLASWELHDTHSYIHRHTRTKQKIKNKKKICNEKEKCRKWQNHRRISHKRQIVDGCRLSAYLRLVRLRVWFQGWCCSDTFFRIIFFFMFLEFCSRSTVYSIWIHSVTFTTATSVGSPKMTHAKNNMNSTKNKIDFSILCIIKSNFINLLKEKWSGPFLQL